MSRLLTACLVCALIPSGCADNNHVKTAVPSLYVQMLALTDKEGNAIPDRVIVEPGKQVLLRLDLQPAENLPDSLDGRAVLPADQWPLSVWIGEERSGLPPLRSFSFQPYASRELPHMLAMRATTTDEAGNILAVEHLAPPRAPARTAEGHVYRYTQLPTRLPKGRHHASVVVFPAADPPPQPGLATAVQRLGPPVVLIEFEIEVQGGT